MGELLKKLSETEKELAAALSEQEEAIPDEHDGDGTTSDVHQTGRVTSPLRKKLQMRTSGAVTVEVRDDQEISNAKNDENEVSLGRSSNTVGAASPEDKTAGKDKDQPSTTSAPSAVVSPQPASVEVPPNTTTTSQKPDFLQEYKQQTNSARNPSSSSSALPSAGSSGASTGDAILKLLQLCLDYAETITGDLESAAKRDAKQIQNLLNSSREQDFDAVRIVNAATELRQRMNTDLKDNLLKFASFGGAGGEQVGDSSMPKISLEQERNNFPHAWLRSFQAVLTRARDLHSDLTSFRIVKELQQTHALEMEKELAKKTITTGIKEQEFEKILKAKVVEVETYYDAQVSKLEAKVEELKLREQQLEQMLQAAAESYQAKLQAEQAGWKVERETMRAEFQVRIQRGKEDVLK